MDNHETHPVGTANPYKPDSAQHQIDFYKLREGLALDHAMKLQDEIKDLRAHLLSERRQKDAAQARADLAEKRLAAAKAEITRANAATAAAYEVAAREVACGCGDGPCQDTTNCSAEDAAAIRALATPAQTAALDKLIAEAVEPYLEALIWCSGSLDFNEGGIARKGWQKLCAPLILAASKKGGM